ncbi:uncharacterized protein F4822DRAFT_38872 [Hypoxylon trugodes]|uniref:uncharacterized protein n=1 Tax=Hypoxylon trugodes TaxID=326681 RepID=UPI00218E0B30|nr:uncharacterized protein F4822DRAFT_38872 [Hypoxylon trugodes]KAI1394157.1 hypothetical protein F4822DRAFT_38872 [Hypoxylon trugodes]
MIQFIVIFLLSLFSQVATFPADVIETGPLVSTSVPSSSFNGTATLDKVTPDDAYYNGSWQNDNNQECNWATKYMPYVNSECTEYCEADTYNWGYKYHRLRYHIKLSANGQNPTNWCKMFKARMMYNCGVRSPDFFNCNEGRAPNIDALRVWAYDGSSGKIVQKPGINLRFDFNPWWEPRDAMHDCVGSSIREATCAGTVFINGLRCIPVLFATPNGAEVDESYVPPNPRCLYNHEVPPDST